MRLVLSLALLVLLPSTSSAVILLSLRAGAEATESVAGPDDLHIFDLDDALWRDSSDAFIGNPLAHGVQIDRAALAQRLQNKRVLILVHGMAKELEAAQKDFFNGLWSMELSASDQTSAYDEVILISWPGTRRISVGSFVKANGLARKSGRLLGGLLKEWRAAGTKVTAVTHSMGSKVMSKALKNGGELEALHLMAPSILQWSMQPWGRWSGNQKQVKDTIAIYYSRKDWALSFTPLSKLGLGHNGTRGRTSRQIVQHDCTDTCNQNAWEALPGNRFRSRSNHSMYWQALPVWAILLKR